MAATDVAHLRERPVTDLVGRRSGSGCSWPARWRSSRACCSSTSRRRIWTCAFSWKFLTLIRSLQRGAAADRGMAIHDLTWAARYCDAVLALKSGQCRWVGDTGAVLTETLIDRVFGVRSHAGPRPTAPPCASISSAPPRRRVACGPAKVSADASRSGAGLLVVERRQRQRIGVAALADVRAVPGGGAADDGHRSARPLVHPRAAPVAPAGQAEALGIRCRKSCCRRPGPTNRTKRPCWTRWPPSKPGASSRWPSGICASKTCVNTEKSCWRAPA